MLKCATSCRACHPRERKLDPRSRFACMDDRLLLFLPGFIEEFLFYSISEPHSHIWWMRMVDKAPSIKLSS